MRVIRGARHHTNRTSKCTGLLSLTQTVCQTTRFSSVRALLLVCLVIQGLKFRFRVERCRARQCLPRSRILSSASVRSHLPPHIDLPESTNTFEAFCAMSEFVSRRSSCHCLSLSITLFHYLLLSFTACHCLSMFLRACLHLPPSGLHISLTRNKPRASSCKPEAPFGSALRC